jgi:hypothetical protein
MPPKHITVTAPEGRKTPIHPMDGAEPGNALLHVEPGTTARVRYSAEVRRSIARGDLIPVDAATGKPAGTPGNYDLEKASAPAAMKVFDKETGDELELEKIHHEKHVHSRPRVKPHDSGTGDAASRPTFDTSDAKKER